MATDAAPDVMRVNSADRTRHRRGGFPERSPVDVHASATDHGHCPIRSPDVRPMSKRPDAPPPDVSRPSLFDFLAILAGLALSIYLMRLVPLNAEPTNPLEPRVAQVFGFLVVLIRLPEGIVLLWPIFFAT